MVKVWSVSLSLSLPFAERLFSEWNQLSSWRDTTPSGTDNMRDNDHTSARTSVVLQSLNLSIFSFNSKEKFTFHARKGETYLLLTSNSSSLLAHKGPNHVHDTRGQFSRHKHTVSGIVRGLLSHKTGIQCSFFGAFNWRNKLYWASEWLRMSEESGVI